MKCARPSPRFSSLFSSLHDAAGKIRRFSPPFQLGFIPVLCALTALLAPGAGAQSESSLTAAAYAVIDHHTGHVLSSYNGRKKLPVASLTKVVTAVVTLDWAQASRRNLEQIVTVPARAANLPNGQGIAWAAQDRVSLRDLLYAALLQSDNVAAQCIAEHVGRQLEAVGEREDPSVPFITQMNALARKMNLTETRFLNPHGLEGLERKLPYSCAEDMAQLTAYAMSHPAFRFIVSQRERRIAIQRADGTTITYQLRNTNELLGESSIDGVKTGTTRQAGQCVAISAGRPPEVRQQGEEFFRTPRRLEVVVLGSQNRFAEARQLLEAGWQQHQHWAASGRPLDPRPSSRLREKLGL